MAREFVTRHGLSVSGKTFISTVDLDVNVNSILVLDGAEVKYRDVSSLPDTYTTGFTYDNANTFTISLNDGTDLSASITTLTGLTLNSLTDVETGLPTGTTDNTYQGRVLYFDTTDDLWKANEEYISTGTVVIWGKKGSAGTIDKGLPVYITGFDNDLHEVELANASSTTTMPVIGFSAEELDDTNVRPIVTFGKLTGLDTTNTVSTLNPNGETWVVNDALYMSSITGGLTKNRPIGASTQIQRIAKVLKVGTTDGQIFIFNTARTAGLPNLTNNKLWLGDSNNIPQEVDITSLPNTNIYTDDGTLDSDRIVDQDTNHITFSGGTGVSIGTGTTSPVCALLELASESQGLLIPRMTQSQRLNISNPLPGLLVYCTDNTSNAKEGMFMYKSLGWVSVL